jgi:hypothetical protein
MISRWTVVAVLLSMLLGGCIAVAASPLLSHRPLPPLGWVCGAGEKLDGSDYVLFVCDDSRAPFLMVHVDKAAYETNVRPLGQGWPNR